MNKDENNTKTKEKNLADKANSVAKLENVNESETTAEKLKKESERKEPIKGSKRFFNIIDKLGDLFFLNIYFVFTCIPIVTIGASFTALYTVTNKMVNDDEGPVRDEYFRAFKNNFKQSTVIWLIDMVMLVLVYLQYVYVVTSDSEAARILFIVLGFEFIFLVFALPLQFPLAARYENTTFNIMKNALVFSLAYLGTWFRVFFTWGFLFVLYFLNTRIFIYTWYLWILILAALFAYVCSMIFIKFYEKLEKPRE